MYLVFIKYLVFIMYLVFIKYLVFIMYLVFIKYLVFRGRLNNDHLKLSLLCSFLIQTTSYRRKTLTVIHT